MELRMFLNRWGLSFDSSVCNSSLLILFSSSWNLSSDSILRLSDLISLITRKTTVERKIIPIAVSGIKTSFDMSVILVILLLFGYAALYTIYMFRWCFYILSINMSHFILFSDTIFSSILKHSWRNICFWNRWWMIYFLLVKQVPVYWLMKATRGTSGCYFDKLGLNVFLFCFDGISMWQTGIECFEE